MLIRIEKFLVRIVVLSLLLVVVAQGLMTKDSMRFYMSWSERMEGQTLPQPVSAPKNESVPSSSVASPNALIGIETNITNLPEAKVLINGKERYTFSNGKVFMRVKAGDTIEIDSSNYNFPIDFKIATGSANLGFPEKGAVYTANSSMVMIGKVIVK